jgi:hypothetical protein
MVAKATTSFTHPFMYVSLSTHLLAASGNRESSKMLLIIIHEETSDHHIMAHSYLHES